MERLLGICLLAFSVSAVAQSGQMEPGQPTQSRDRPQQYDVGEADKQQEAPAHMRDQASSDDRQHMQTHRDQGNEQARGQQQTQALEQLANEHRNLSTFVKALESTGLADAVANGEYTAFAPTDEAFEQLGKSVDEMMRAENQEQLVALLRNHLVADRVDAERARELNKAMTVGGATLNLAESDGELTVNGAPIEEADIRAGGLIVHTIGEVLQPESADQQPSVAGQQRGMSSDERPQGGSAESVAGQTEEPQE